MGCNFPNHAFYTGYTLEDSGGKAYRICGGDVEFIHKPIADIVPNEVISKKRLYSDRPGTFYQDVLIRDYVEIPCRKCIGCRLKIAKDWANRCLLEAKCWQHNYFITLTYNNENLPVNEETGVTTLNPDDVMNFLKRLRIHWERKHNWKSDIIWENDKVGTEILSGDNPGIRFYGCGEYGTKTHRPHYHILGFNLPIFDLEYLKLTELGDTLYYSEEIAKIWGKGHVWIGEVNWNTACYVSRYIMKKQIGKDAAELYEWMGEDQEFQRMSLKPGIGWFYYYRHKDEIYRYDEILIKKRSKKIKFDKFLDGNIQTKVESIKPPKYFDKCYDMEDHEFMETLKKARKQSAKASQEISMMKTTKNRNDYLEQKENRLKHSIRLLKREME